MDWSIIGTSITLGIALLAAGGLVVWKAMATGTADGVKIEGFKFAAADFKTFSTLIEALRAQRGGANFSESGFLCSPIVLLALADRLDLDALSILIARFWTPIQAVRIGAKHAKPNLVRAAVAFGIPVPYLKETLLIATGEEVKAFLRAQLPPEPTSGPARQDAPQPIDDLLPT